MTASVIIPCFNYGRFVGDAVESALNQTYKDVEVIVVDDGSTDETAEVVARYPAVHLIRTPNQGVCVARNAGMAASSGEFLVFLDADDVLVAEAIATSAERLRTCPDCAFVYGHEVHFDENGTLPQRGLSPGKSVEGDPYAEMLRWNHPMRAPGAMLYRRSAVERISGFSKSAGGAADLDINLRLARDHPIVCNDRVVLRTRIHGSNMARRWAYMLGSAVRVQKAEAGFVNAQPEYRAAYESGLRLARDYFGRNLERQLPAKLSAMAIGSLAGDLLALARYAPARFVRLPFRLARRAARRGLLQSTERGA
jgi:glycosyltransferase involved in cell wall biosynthesis